MRSGEETRLVVETLLEVIPGTQIVAIITAGSVPFEGLEMEPLISEGVQEPFEHISQLVKEALASPSAIEDLSTVIGGVEWGVLVNPIEVRDGVVVGVLIVAREGRVWSTRERSLGRGFGGLLSHVAAQFLRENKLLHQQRLDELVAGVAERLMSATATSRHEVLDWTVRVLCEFLEADVAFIRRNDHVRGLSIMEAEWPRRENVPDPDPLGEVPFDSDPVFAATRDLRAPYLPGVEDYEEYLANVEASAGLEKYLAHLEEATGMGPTYGAAVPLLMHDKTWG
ncbi:MAG: hypothetical protein HKL85_01310, partial [Acidimicrobiaceae bacterium]|nr:hypothetical protein [Acidimicrobiaceae bacterium]